MDKPNQIPDWENSKIFGINKELAHSTLNSLDNKENSKKKREESRYYKTLNGIWKFNWVEKPADRPINFFDI
ncbi:MAG: hypothetical protein ACTSO6_01910, partial [Promethearchaeota archaeon]